MATSQNGVYKWLIQNTMEWQNSKLAGKLHKLYQGYAYIPNRLVTSAGSHSVASGATIRALINWPKTALFDNSMNSSKLHQSIIFCSSCSHNSLFLNSDTLRVSMSRHFISFLLANCNTITPSSKKPPSLQPHLENH